MARYLVKEEIQRAIDETDTVTDAASLLGVPRSTLYSHIQKHGIEKGGERILDIELPELEETDLTYEEIKEKRLREYDRKNVALNQRRLIEAKVKTNEPIALLIFGDPHVDNPGTDLRTLLEHTEIINETEGMYAANIGDTTDNWIGRLREKYADSATTATEAWKLAEGWIQELEGKWLFLIGGNHDAWSGQGDPLKWICRGIKAHYEPHQYRVRLSFPNGSEAIINARHDWPGHSQWNPTHGPLKAAELGYRDDIYIAGHRHISGYQNFKAGDGTIIHAARVASYKIWDDYALQRGFRDHNISPCVVFTFDPHDDSPDRIKHFWNPRKAAEYLGHLRGRS